MAAATTSTLPQPANDPAYGLHLNQATYQGCYSSMGDLVDQGEYEYQALGWCQPLCVRQNQPVLALTTGSNCSCGALVPPLSALVDDSKCNAPCDGFQNDTCGGMGTYQVWLSGIEVNVGHSSNDDTSSSLLSSLSSTTASKSSSITPPPVAQSTTIVSGPSTVFVNRPDSTSAQVVYTTQVVQKPTGGPNKTAIAVGVVVGVLALATIIGGLLLWFRHKRRMAADAEHRRTSAAIQSNANPFIGANEKPPSTISLSDSRLEPSAMFARRQSGGSIADNQDYSRRILKVTNPDGS
ncbi:hypothetical protein MMC25_001391 [Agyrium rufum]|nr:hypothetical protein [Agyrium rufum]